MSSGYLIRQNQAMERASDRICSCGHRVGEHHELRDTWNAERDEFVSHPDHRPGEFHCDHSTCRCVIS